MKYFLTLLLFALFLFPVRADAQRTTYESLLQRSDQPSSYISHVVLPNQEGNASVGVMFRIDYDMIPFLRVRSSMEYVPEEAEYFAPVQMGFEIFEGSYRSRRGSRSPQGSSIFRDNYEDTVYVQNFDQTRSRLDHIQGLVTTELDPGSYHYELQLTRAQSVREQSSTLRNIQVPEQDTLSVVNMVLLDNFERNENEFDAQFLNYGENVLYGTDYQLLLILPEQDEEEQYNLSIRQMQSGTSDEAESSAVYESTLQADDIFYGRGFRMMEENNTIKLAMETGDSGTRFGLLSVPNSNFENARYQIEVRNSEDETVARRVVSSRWLDMPVSLLNIDVAINMLRFIVDDDELDRLQSGSASEKERKFREFWDQRDPTPETEFNELMAEYYNRIDYVFRNFSSLQTPGYESDRGRAYIVYGAPDNIERRLPTGEPTREIWEYPNRELVFEATSGFGDFRLVSER